MGFYPDDFPSLGLDLFLPDEFFFAMSLSVGIAVFIKDYIDVFVEGSEKYPRALCGIFLAGAWLFVYVCLNMSIKLEGLAAMQGVLQLARSSLLLGAVFMLVGPLIVLTPQLKITVTNVIARAVVRAAHKKETRYTSFVLFCLVFATQGVVVYTLSLVLDRVFGMTILNTIGLSACYCLLCIMYLGAYYTALLRKDIIINGHNPLKTLRDCFAFTETKEYLYSYIVLFFIKMLGSFGITLAFFIIDVRNINNTTGSSSSSLAICVIFFLVTLFSIIVSAVFLFNEAFRIKKTVVIEQQEQALEPAPQRVDLLPMPELEPVEEIQRPSSDSLKLDLAAPRLQSTDLDAHVENGLFGDYAGARVDEGKQSRQRLRRRDDDDHDHAPAARIQIPSLAIVEPVPRPAPAPVARPMATPSPPPPPPPPSAAALTPQSQLQAPAPPPPPAAVQPASSLEAYGGMPPPGASLARPSRDEMQAMFGGQPSQPSPGFYPGAGLPSSSSSASVAAGPPPPPPPPASAPAPKPIVQAAGGVAPIMQGGGGRGGGPLRSSVPAAGLDMRVKMNRNTDKKEKKSKYNDDDDDLLEDKKSEALKKKSSIFSKAAMAASNKSEDSKGQSSSRPTTTVIAAAAAAAAAAASPPPARRTSALAAAAPEMDEEEDQRAESDTEEPMSKAENKRTSSPAAAAAAATALAAEAEAEGKWDLSVESSADEGDSQEQAAAAVQQRRQDPGEQYPLTSFDGLPPHKCFVLPSTGPSPFGPAASGLFKCQDEVVMCCPDRNALVAITFSKQARVLLALPDIEPTCGVQRPDGTIVVGDRRGNRVVRLQADGRLLWTVAQVAGDGVGAESGPAHFGSVTSIAVCPDGSIVVLDAENARLVVLAEDGSFAGLLLPVGAVAKPVSMVRHENTLFVLDAVCHVVVQVDLMTRAVLATLRLDAFAHNREAASQWTAVAVQQQFRHVTVMVADEANSRIVTLHLDGRGTPQDHNVPAGPLGLLHVDRVGLFIRFAGTGAGGEQGGEQGGVAFVPS